MTAPRIALATCRSLRPQEHDDDALHQALIDRGCDVVQPCWDDEAFDWSGCAWTLIRTTWDYTSRVDEYRRWIDRMDAVGNLLNPPAVVRWNLDKRYLRDLEDRGVQTIPTLWVESAAAFDRSRCSRWLREHGGDAALFVKPSIGATASRTLRITHDDAGLAAAESHVGDLVGDGLVALVQPYLEQVESVGERSAIVIDGAVTHAVTKTPVPGDYRVQDDWGADDRPHDPTPAEQRLIDATLAAMAATIREISPTTELPLAYGRVDWLTDRQGTPCLVELELIEPSLFLRHGPQAAEALAGRLLRSQSPISVGRVV